MQNIGLVLLLLMFLISVEKVECQVNHYDSYIAIKHQPSDEANLKRVESDTLHNFVDLCTMLISNCALQRKARVRELLLELAAYGFQRNYIEELLAKYGCAVSELIEHDSDFIEKYEQIEEEYTNRIANGPIVNMIDEMYELDQAARNIDETAERKQSVNAVDSLNLLRIESLLFANQIASKRIGVKQEENLYIMMLHTFRYASEERYNRLCEKLHELVKQKKFNPIWFANIVDERLRVRESSDYPKYNFLRSVPVSEQKNIEIQSNRRLIHAY